MQLTIEHIIATFIMGVVTGVLSTLLLTRRELTLETIVSLLIVSIWLAMHTSEFFFEHEVSWLMDFAGFGAAGNFIGIKLSDVSDKAKVFIRK